MSFFSELKRRNVIKVALAYVIVGWLLMQVAEVMAPALRLPDWSLSFVAFLLILGFPVALIFAWAFEMTPEGLKKEKDVVRDDSITPATGRKLDFAIIALLVLAVGYFAYDKFVLDPRRDAELVAQHQASAPAPTEQTANEADRRSIAVLPFANRSANEENAAFFSDGVHDEILTNLSKIGDLKVISRTSVMNYRDSDKSMPEIGQELGVATLLEGGVQRAGDSIRINVQLIDAVTDEHIWAEVYDRQLSAENIFAIQSEIAQSIAEALHAALSPEELKQLTDRPTEILEALDHYLIATQYFRRQNWDALEQALAEAQQAVALDPEFKEAQALVALTYGNLVGTGARARDEVAEPWKTAVDRALILDPNSGPAHAALATYLMNMNLPGVDKAWSRSHELDPDNVDILFEYARFLSRTGDPETAGELLEKARELDPMSSILWFSLGRNYAILGEKELAFEAYARVRAIDPVTSMGKGPVAGLFFSAHEFHQSMYWLYQGWQADRKDLDLPNWVVLLYMNMGDLDAARTVLEYIQPVDPDFPFTLSNQAMLLTFQGQLDAAVPLAREHMERNLQSRWGSGEVVSRIMLLDAVARQDPLPALALMRSVHPELFQSAPDVFATNILPAVNTASLLQMAGDEASATDLLEAIIETAERPWELAGDRHAWRVTAKAQALALMGEDRAALEAILELTTDGWGLNWKWDAELNPIFASLRPLPEFQTMLDGLRDEMAIQLQEVRDMAERGEISPPQARIMESSE